MEELSVEMMLPAVEAEEGSRQNDPDCQNMRYMIQPVGASTNQFEATPQVMSDKNLPLNGPTEQGCGTHSGVILKRAGTFFRARWSSTFMDSPAQADVCRLFRLNGNILKT